MLQKWVPTWGNTTTMYESHTKQGQDKKNST